MITLFEIAGKPIDPSRSSRATIECFRRIRQRTHIGSREPICGLSIRRRIGFEVRSEHTDRYRRPRRRHRHLRSLLVPRQDQAQT